MTPDNLLSELRKMFHYYPNRITTTIRRASLEEDGDFSRLRTQEDYTRDSSRITLL